LLQTSKTANLTGLRNRPNLQASSTLRDSSNCNNLKSLLTGPGLRNSRSHRFEQQAGICRFVNLQESSSCCKPPKATQQGQICEDGADLQNLPTGPDLQICQILHLCRVLQTWPDLADCLHPLQRGPTWPTASTLCNVPNSSNGGDALVLERLKSSGSSSF
jgi:hypothetical protein